MLDTGQSTEKPGLRHYWQIFLRRKWVIILPIICIVSIAVPGSFFIEPVYQADATLISQELGAGSVLRRVANVPVPQREQMSTIRYKIESRRNMGEVADKVGLVEYLRNTGKDMTNYELVSYLRERIKIQSRGGTVIQISVKHENPGMAKKIADAVVDVYIESTLRWRQTTVGDTTNFIKSELEAYARQLRDAEEALAKAQEKGVLDSLSPESNSLIDQLAVLKINLVEVEVDLQEARIELRNAERFTSDDAMSAQSSVYYMDPELDKLNAELAGLQAQYEQLSTNYTDQYPVMKGLVGKIIQTQDAIEKQKAESNRQHQNIAMRLQFWGDRVRSFEIKSTALNDKIAEYDKKLQRLPQRQLELARLQREKSVAEGTYSMLLQRLNESELLKSSELRKMGRVAEPLDYAIPPEHPLSPNKKRIAFLAVIMGLGIGAGTAYLLEFFDRSLRSVDEAAEYLGLPVLAAIPRLVTPESERKTRKRRRVKIVCIASISMLVVVLAVDIVSSELLARDSLFLNIAQRGLGFVEKYR